MLLFGDSRQSSRSEKYFGPKPSSASFTKSSILKSIFDTENHTQKTRKILRNGIMCFILLVWVKTLASVRIWSFLYFLCSTLTSGACVCVCEINIHIIFCLKKEKSLSKGQTVLSILPIKAHLCCCTWSRVLNSKMSLHASWSLRRCSSVLGYTTRGSASSSSSSSGLYASAQTAAGQTH